MNNIKRILVTGGAGFLGSNLCEKLLYKGNEVICMDNFYTGRKENISELLKNKNFKVIEHDVEEYYDVQVDEIYNLACPASPPHYQKSPTKTTKTSVLGAINVLELAKKYNSKVLQASTSEVYGDPLEHPQDELYRGNVNPIGIRACYDEGKRCAESLYFDYNREFKTRTKVVRIFNTYGPNMDPLDGRVVSNFIIQALENKDITIYGDGKQTRSFCYVDDLIDGLIRMMESEDNIIGPVNLGNPNEFTVYDLAKKVIDFTKSSSKIIYKELPKDDPTRRKPNINKAYKLLNWEPSIQLNEGIIKTIKYFKTRN